MTLALVGVWRVDGLILVRSARSLVSQQEMVWWKWLGSALYRRFSYRARSSDLCRTELDGLTVLHSATGMPVHTRRALTPSSSPIVRL